MKEKLLLALKTKFANLGFTDKAFDGVANFLVATVTEDSQIETALSGVEPLLKAFQGDADSRVNTAIRTTEEKLKSPGADPNNPEPKKNDPPAGETPTEKLIREMAEGMKALQGEITSLKAGGVVANRKTAIETALKGAPKFLDGILKDFDRLTFKDDADFEAWKNDIVTTRLPDALKVEGESDVKGITAPISGTAPVNGKTSFADDMKSAVDAQLAAKAAKTPAPTA